jgi:hypothetical protein
MATEQGRSKQMTEKSGSRKTAPDEGVAISAIDAALSRIQDPQARRRILQWAVSAFGGGAPLTDGTAPTAGMTAITPSSLAASGAAMATITSAKAFMATKRPTTDVYRAVCLAYILLHKNKVTTFKAKELTALARGEAATPFNHPAMAVGNAGRSGLFAPAGGGAKQLTPKGEAVAEALPDAAKVSEVLKAFPTKRRSKKQTRKAKATS